MAIVPTGETFVPELDRTAVRKALTKEAVNIKAESCPACDNVMVSGICLNTNCETNKKST